MSQGKKDKFLPVFFGALGVATLGLGFLSYSASSDADDAKKTYDGKLSELEKLEKAPLSRTDANADKKAELVDAYVKKVVQLDDALQAYQVPEKEITADVFQRELKKTIDDFLAAAKAKGVTLPKNFDFGMTKYLSTMAADTAPQLNAQLQALVYLGTAALESGVIEINSFARQELEFEKEKPNEPKPDSKDKRPGARPKTAAAPKAGDKKAPKEAAGSNESGILERQPISIVLTGKNDPILKFLAALANTSPDTSPYFFEIRALKVENETKEGPLKNIDVKEEEKPDPTNKDAPPIKTDAVFVLGNEKVMLLLELDIVRFIPEPPDEKEKPDGKPANKGEAAKPAESKPAGSKTTEDKAAESKPAEAKPAETKPVENKPVGSGQSAPAN